MPTQTHLNAYLTPCPGYGWSGGPQFKTQIVELQSGREKRNAMWEQARHRFIAPYLNITKEAYREIKQMHLTCRGMLYAFRFVDELDHTADEDLFGIGDGTTTEFQLGKISTIDGIQYFRKVFAPANNINFKIYSDGIEITTGFTVDYDTGLITFDAASDDEAVLRWSGNFDIWVRFEQDDLPFSIDNVNAVNGSVSLIEVAPPES